MGTDPSTTYRDRVAAIARDIDGYLGGAELWQHTDGRSFYGVMTDLLPELFVRYAADDYIDCYNCDGFAPGCEVCAPHRIRLAPADAATRDDLAQALEAAIRATGAVDVYYDDTALVDAVDKAMQTEAADA